MQISPADLSASSPTKPGNPPHLECRPTLLTTFCLHPDILLFSGRTEAISFRALLPPILCPGSEQRLTICIYGGRKEEGEGGRGKAALGGGAWVLS